MVVSHELCCSMRRLSCVLYVEAFRRAPKWLMRVGGGLKFIPCVSSAPRTSHVHAVLVKGELPYRAAVPRGVVLKARKVFGR